MATTANTTSIIDVVVAFLGRELAHPDRARPLLPDAQDAGRRVPMSQRRIVPYCYNRHIFDDGVPKWSDPFVTMLDKVLLQPLERLFPLTSFGLIHDGTIGQGSKS